VDIGKLTDVVCGGGSDDEDSGRCHGGVRPVAGETAMIKAPVAVETATIENE
jgi:hypothetical protein